MNKRERELSAPGACLRCGRDSPDGRNTAGRCLDCHNAEYYQSRERRRAELDAMPRCQYCNRRATLVVGVKYGRWTRAYLCGRHFKIAQACAARFGFLGLAANWSGAEVMALLVNAGHQLLRPIDHPSYRKEVQTDAV